MIRPLTGFLLSMMMLPAFARGETGGPPPETLTLPDAIRTAAERHVSVTVSSKRVQEALKRQEQSRAVLLPRISAGVSETRQTRNLEAQGISLPGQDPLVGPFNTFDARGFLSLSLFDVSAYKRLRQAKSSRRMAEAELALARQDAMALVASLYVQARRAEERARLAQTLVRQEDARYQVAQARFREGVGTRVEQEAAASSLMSRRRDRDEAEAEAAERRRDLAAALRRPLDRPIRFPSVKNEPEIRFSADAGPPPPHPELIRARESVRQKTDRLSAARSERLPRLSVTADYGLSGKSVSDSETTYSYGAKVSVPLLEGGAIGARSGEANAQREAGQAQLEDVEAQLEAEQASARDAIGQASNLIRSREASFSVAERERALAAARKNNGSGSELEWEEAKAREAISLDSLRSAVAAYEMAAVRLARSRGQMEMLIHD